MVTRRNSPLLQQLKKTALIAFGVVLLAYPLDWVIWRVRMMAGHGMGSVEITDTTAATLKGNHFEVYAQQSNTVNCSVSFLPEAGAGACWWLRRHPQVVTQY